MLSFAARHGKWCLVLGLIAGLSAPALAAQVKAALPHLIAALLFLAAFRIGPQAVVRGLRDAGTALRLVGLYQVVAPLAVFGIATLTGGMASTAALALILMLAAPSVTGSPNFAILMGQNPASALRLLVVGTALFPVTVVPILWLMPALDTTTVFASAVRLAAVVLTAAGAAFALRRFAVRDLAARHQNAVDGASAILLGVVVVGLMSAVGPLMLTDPARFFAWLAFACAVNFGAQWLAWTTVGPLLPNEDRAGATIVAGNRNIALFLVALPPAATDPLLEFIGCYQIPMYLTPILMGRVYSRSAART